MSIKENTIVSTTDTKVTLLQWLKTLDKNVTELHEKGVKPYYKKYTGYEFVKEFIDKGICIETCFIETDDYLMFLSGQFEIYSIDNTAGSRNCKGLLVQYDKTSEDRWAYCDFFFDITTDETGNINIDDVEGESSPYSQIVLSQNLIDAKDELYGDIQSAKTEIQNTTNFKLLTSELNTAGKLLFLTDGANQFAYGVSIFGSTYVFGRFGYSPKNYTRKVQGFVTKGDEIYYTTGAAEVNHVTGEIENAVSGTQLKEAVRLATQKTYWHTINLHNSGTLSDVHITIVIPSHSSTPVSNVQDLLAIGAGDIWGCSGTIATTDSALPIVTFDGVKFGATADATIFSGTLGRTYTLTQLIAKSLEYSDNVKEVK